MTYAIASVVLWVLTAGAVVAQTAATAPAGAQRTPVHLTPQQRTIIYQSVTGKRRPPPPADVPAIAG